MTTVEIIEVGARDGLQNEAVLFSTEQKLSLLTRAMDAGIKRLEVASFVHPKRVPQMADAEAVVKGLPTNDDTTYIALTLNERGLERALDTRAYKNGGINEIGCVASATDGFGTRNQGQTMAESITVSKNIMHKALAEGLSAQVTISAAFGCPFEGRVPHSRIIEMALELAEANPREIAIADTIGVAAPQKVADLFAALKEKLPHIPLRAHFHNTRNTGLANAWQAYLSGVTILDSSVAGLGGCPFAPKATGNIATEDLLYLLQESDVTTSIDLEKMIDLGRWVERQIDRTPPAMVSQAGGFPDPITL